jgi:hypothetical protein
MTAIPQLDIPEILVDNEEHKDDDDAQQQQRQRSQKQKQQQQQQDQQPAAASRSRAKSSAAASAFGSDSSSLLSQYSSRGKSQHQSWASGLGADLSSLDDPYGHPLAGPRASSSRQAAPSGTRSGRHSQTSASPFEWAGSGPGPGEGVGGDGDDGTGLGRRGSAVDPSVVRDMLDDSVWVESLRRSATTMRKSGWGSGGFK